MFSLIVDHLTRREIAADLALLGCFVLAWFAPHRGDRAFSAVERFGSRLATKRGWAIVSIAAFTIILRVSLLWALPVPVPHAHDEFSYLLAADTFAHGRLTNPPHPMWVFFDTIHVNQQPTYMSKYPPLQGGVLAFGQLLGNPWIGMLLADAAMCAAVLWALQGWVRPRWALLGALLVVFRIGIFSYFVNSYWGGAIAAIGGALVIGALPRIRRRVCTRDAIILALGAVILANSRPFEGLIFCFPVMAVLVVWLLGNRGPVWKVAATRIVLPFCTVMLLCVIFIAYFNWRGTGNPLLTPYELNEQAYVSTPTLFWQKLRPPLHYQNAQFESFYNVWARNLWQEDRVSSPRAALGYATSNFVKIVYFYLWPELCILLLIPLPWILADRRVRFPLLQVALCFFGFLVIPWFQPHYAAPLLATLFILIVEGTRHLRQWRHKGRRVGMALSRVVFVFAVVLAPLHPHAEALGHPQPIDLDYRPQIEAQLNADSGKHLVIVRYAPDHDVLSEWVYNRADIDAAKVVWAREIPGIDIQPLLQYFRQRQVWMLEPDVSPPRLSHYEDPPSAATPK